MINFKVIVLGSQGVGKSSLIMRYIKGEFSQNYNVTVGVQFATKIVRVQSGLEVRIQIWDTAGQQFFRALVKSFYQGISAVFLVYSIDNLKSLKQLKGWVDEVRQNSHQQVVMFLIGSRADCQEKRQVDPQVAADFLKQIQGAFFVQTSAKTGMNIELLFQKAANYLYKKFTTNQSYKQLVQPSSNNNQLMNSNAKNIRGTSIMLKQQNFNSEMSKSKKSDCCK